MDETVQVPSRLLYCFPHVIVAVKVEDIRDEVEGVLVVLDLGVEPGQVEPIGDVVLVDFAKVFIASRGDELCSQTRNQCVSMAIGNFLTGCSSNERSQQQQRLLEKKSIPSRANSWHSHSQTRSQSHPWPAITKSMLGA